MGVSTLTEPAGECDGSNRKTTAPGASGPASSAMLNETWLTGAAKSIVSSPFAFPTKFGGWIPGVGPGPTNVLNVASVEGTPPIVNVKVAPLSDTPFTVC